MSTLPVGVVAPTAIASDLNGTLYVVDGSGLEKVTPDGVIATLHSPLLDTVRAIALTTDAQGNVYVFGNTGTGWRVLQISPDGGTKTVVTAPAFQSPGCWGGAIARDADGTLYSATPRDASAACVARISPDGVGVKIAGTSALPSGTLLGPLPGGLDYAAQIAFLGPRRIALLRPGGVIEIVLP